MGANYKMILTKVSNYIHSRLKAIEKKKGLSDYKFLQMAAESIALYADDKHNLTPEMERCMSMFEHLEGWKDALSFADPTAKMEIGEAIYFLYDSEGKRKGARAVHVMKPLFGHWTQDINIQHIIERMFCLLIPERYRRLRLLAAELGCSSQIELLDYFIDHFTKEEDVAELRRMFEDAARAENGKPLEYGKRTRRKRHLTPDHMDGDQHTITFTEEDKEIEDNSLY